MSFPKSLSVFAAAALLCGTASAVNLIVDPSFEGGGLTWASEEHAGVDGQDPQLAHTGVRMGFVNGRFFDSGNGKLYQDVVGTVAGQHYDIVFWIAQNGSASANRLTVSFGGKKLYDEPQSLQFPVMPVAPIYRKFEFDNVEAPVSLSRFLFEGARVDQTFFIDDVAVVPTAVPEPETWALMLGGLALMAAVARRQRRHVYRFK